MPYIRIETNQEMRNDKEFCLKVSKLISDITERPEGYVMVSFAMNQIMSFAGQIDPCVFVDMRGIMLDEDSFSTFSQEITRFLENELRIPGQRIYINFSSVESSCWGYNGDTF